MTKLIEEIDSRFFSGNSVPVTRTYLNANEWLTIKELILASQSVSEPVAKVVATDELGLNCLQWISADHSCRVNAGDLLYTHAQPTSLSANEQSSVLAVALEALAWADGQLNSELIKHAISSIHKAITNKKAGE